MCGITLPKSNAEKFNTVTSNNNSEYIFDKLFKHPSKSNKLKMNVLNYIKNENYYVTINKNFQSCLNNKVKNKSKLFKKLNVSYRTMWRILKKTDYWINVQDYLNLCEILSLPKSIVIKNIVKLKTKNSFPITTKNINIYTKEFFRILGHMLGDGGIHIIEKEGKYRAFYVNNNQKLLNSFEKDVKEIFENVKLYSRKRIGHGDEIWLPSTIGFMFYEFLNYKQLDKYKRVPKLVFDAKDELKCSFLQAIFDDEGHVSVDKHMIVLSLGNKELLEDIRSLLLSSGIYCNPISKLTPKNRSIMYRFNITSKNNLIAFYNKVNFMHPSKSQRIERLVLKYR